jgi:ribonuclease-3
LNLYVPYLKEMDVQNLGKDAKTLLQEYLQGKHLSLPNYNVVGLQGEAHAQSFEVDCVIPSLKITARGTGTTRRNAEQQAAQAAYQQLTAAK